MTDHPDFLHDDSCSTCRAHRRIVDEVRREMLEELRVALDTAGIARPWSPHEEWKRLLGTLSHGGK